MALMDLRCPVPNQGAHRLAWVIGMHANPGAALRELESIIGGNTVERILCGSLRPAERMGADIARWSRWAIETEDFYRTCPLRWWEAPPERRSAWRMPMPQRTAVRGGYVLNEKCPSIAISDELSGTLAEARG